MLNEMPLEEFRSYTDTEINRTRMENVRVVVKKKQRRRRYERVAGAKVVLKPVHLSCLFGGNIGGFGRPGFDTEFAKLFDFATIGTFATAIEQPGTLEYIVALADWCKSKGIIVKCHPLVYNLEPLRPPSMAGDYRRVDGT